MLHLLDELTGRHSWWPFDGLEKEVQHLWPDFFGAFAQTQNRVPVNLYTNDQAVKVTVRIPGWKAEWFDLSLEGNQLYLKGEAVSGEAEEKEGGHAYRAISRVVTLPFRVQEDKVEAVYKNGILTIDLIRHEQDKPRKIQIESN